MKFWYISWNFIRFHQPLLYFIIFCLILKYFVIDVYDLGPIFYACLISMTQVLAPKRCFIYKQKKNCCLLQLSNSLQLRYMSLIYDMAQKFELKGNKIITQVKNFWGLSYLDNTYLSCKKFESCSKSKKIIT